MSYLVTGGTGLLGSRIVRDLAKDSETVVAYDLFPDTNILKMLLTEEESTTVKVVAGDVVDFDYLMNIVKENNIDVIIHTATILGQETKANPRRAAMVNAQGTINVFETARLLELKKVVWASAGAIFTAGKYKEEYIPNDAPHYPRELYGACKSFGENAADCYFQEFGVDITAPRYSCLIFGAGQQRGGPAVMVRELMLNPALGKPGRVPLGDDTVAWLYVDDAARAALLACKHHRVKTGAFNIVGLVHPVRELADYVRELLPDAHIELLPGRRDNVTSKLETAVTEKELGFRPQWSVKQGIKETINMERRYQGLPPV